PCWFDSGQGHHAFRNPAKSCRLRVSGKPARERGEYPRPGDRPRTLHMKLSLASTGAEPGARFLEHVKLAELLGFHAFFHGDKKWAREGLSRLGAATQCTTRLGLGFGVVDAGARHPAYLAQAARTACRDGAARAR